MGESDDATERWGELTDELVALTERITASYREVAGEAGPSEEEIREALRTLAGAWGQVSASVGRAWGDPAVRLHLGRAAGSLSRAVSATLSELGRNGGPEDDTPPDTGS
jgi:hypothetical protein